MSKGSLPLCPGQPLPEAGQASGTAGTCIMVDADACPVKEEIYKVAFRHAVAVTVVSNAALRVPLHPLVARQVVSSGFDAADDWIAERVHAGTIVVTTDILLADRCLKAGGQVLAPTGRPFTAASIGGAIATRAIMADLRAGGDRLGGPAPFTKADRSRFLQALDAMVVRAARSGGPRHMVRPTNIQRPSASS